MGKLNEVSVGRDGQPDGVAASKMLGQRSYLISGFTLLICAAYLDNVRGPLLPVIADSLGVSYGAVSWILILGSVAAVFATIGLLPLLERMSDRKVAAGVAALGLVTTFLVHGVTSFPSLLVFGAVLGAAVATMGSMANVLTVRGASPANLGRMLSGLHLMYACGSVAGPMLVGALLEREIGWRWLISVPAGLLLLVMGLNLRSWGGASATFEVSAPKPGPVPRRAAFVLLLFGTYVTGEVLASMWLVTYLTEVHQFSIAESSNYMIGFFVAMGLSRGACTFFYSSRYEKPVLYGSLLVFCLAFSIGLSGNPLGFVGAGLVGPFFPIFFGRMSADFPQHWRSMMISVIVFMQMLLAVLHFVLGRMIDAIGIETAYFFPIGLMVGAVVFLFVYFLVVRSPSEQMPSGSGGLSP